MSTKKSVLKFVFIATIFSLALLACQPQDAAAEPGKSASPTPQNTEVIIHQAPPTPLPPAPACTNCLVTIKDNKPSPALATGWTISEDGLDYIFNLKTGASFPDGTPLNADAVAANFNRWFDPKDPARGSGSYDFWVAAFGGFKGEKDASGKPKCVFDGIERVDNFTVLIHLNKPFDAFLTSIAQPDFAIVSPASFK
jgi:ABC-type transport system substrate-binding protein